MKSTKYILQTCLLIFICLVLTSCFESRNRRYHDDPTVALAFKSSMATSATVNSSGTLTVLTELIGHQRSQPLDITLAVNDSITTADPSMYSFPKTVTIEADSSTALFDVHIKNTVPAGKQKVLGISITGTSDPNISMKINVNIRTLRIAINGPSVK